jgi:hypothetical protein
LVDEAVSLILRQAFKVKEIPSQNSSIDYEALAEELVSASKATSAAIGQV